MPNFKHPIDIGLDWGSYWPHLLMASDCRSDKEKTFLYRTNLPALALFLFHFVNFPFFFKFFLHNCTSLCKCPLGHGLENYNFNLMKSKAGANDRPKIITCYDCNNVTQNRYYYCTSCSYNICFNCYMRKLYAL